MKPVRALIDAVRSFKLIEHMNDDELLQAVRRDATALDGVLTLLAIGFLAFLVHRFDMGTTGWIGVAALFIVRIERLSRRLDAAGRLLDRYTAELSELRRRA